MRVLLIVCMASLAGCGDDTTTAGHGNGGDMSAQAGDDLASSAPDMATCMFRTFLGYPGTNASPLTFDCSCGCMIDAFANTIVNENWGASTSGGAGFVPTASGLQLSLATTTTSASPSLASLASEGPIARFFLDGDFDLQVDYDLNTSAPPGEAHLVLGVRYPNTVEGIPVYEVERAREADGSEVYVTALGGVPAVQVATTATHGTLRLTRAGFTLKSYGDGQLVSTLIAQDANRLEVTLAGALASCTDADAGTSCTFGPSWRNLQLNHGTLVNQP
ncbi:MAG TPA: hypothetical protein VHB97_09545 [Polyangia bacterium]|nr:hypothetical protein [Polyangia bacterium]